ncbi:hypothetical protein CKO50_07400 [Pseudoalteromonas sp. HM-SA03]|uniref:TPR end-of-group domain-containing protein n=1 Tax=Pseudoalteromonas sp. HM-SA03 TaxID=2029678 RepID=UPI000BAE3D4C|nr:hypothetical protein [Pseudoalteromonas sp. HM-SA03]PAY01887.1 hypothetical protein CKO50_07400 [Pseudoalteromonas sp. HM-SA03]
MKNIIKIIVVAHCFAQISFASTVGLINNISEVKHVDNIQPPRNDVAIITDLNPVALSTPSANSDSDINIILNPGTSNEITNTEKPPANSNKLIKLEKRIDELDKLAKKNALLLLSTQTLYNEQKDWNNTIISWLGGGLGSVSILIGIIAFVISRRAQESADLAFQSIKVAADSAKAKLEDISRFRSEVDSFKKEMDESQKTVERFEALSVAIDLDLAILVNSESKLNSINFLITDYRQANDTKLKKRLKDGLNQLIGIRKKLEEHLDLLEKPLFNGVKPELKKTIKEHIFRNLLIQSLVTKDLENPSRAIELLTDAEKVCDSNKQLSLVYYNKACYYSLIDVLSSAAKYLAKAIELSPSIRDGVREDSDLDNLRNNATLMSKALSGDSDD